MPFFLSSHASFPKEIHFPTPAPSVMTELKTFLQLTFSSTASLSFSKLVFGKDGVSRGALSGF